ncbi:MAG: hypothetical protein HWE39_10135 [Oceanospirillaceae bacterium]|nr:hypothetical protein [Oceanospirillaceae bacterium]
MLVNSMMKLGYPNEFVEQAARHLTPLEFDTQCDRSVQGTLRVAAQDLESFTWDGRHIMTLGRYSLSAKLSLRPCRTKGMKEMECLWPHKEMAKLLEQLPA